MVETARRLVLEKILKEKQIHHILNQAIGDDVAWVLNGSEIKQAMEDGIAGFLGDHMKAVLHVDVKGEKKKVHLFLKRIPVNNKPKADYINESKYFGREKLMFKLLEEICKDGPNPWGVRAYIYTDYIVVMPDLTFLGYSPRNFLETLDAEHIFVTTTSIARFHAAYINYETKKTIDLKRPYTITQDFSDLLKEPSFCDSPWLKTCSKLSTNLLKSFSLKSYRNMPDLESKLAVLYLEACDSLREYEDTVNVLLHKDLWVNNIMFKYENNVPVNAVLVDYQCLRYGPPAYDLMIFLYLTTDRRFRQEREKDVLDHYYSILVKNLNNDSKRRLCGLGYDKADFLKWCEKGRMFGMFQAVGTHPYILMDPNTAQETYDDPETYDRYFREDRSEPVLAHANRCEPYKQRNLEVTEEFVETYLLK